MPRKLPMHVERWRDRHGKVRTYFRRGKGGRLTLPNEIGSPEFDRAYADALAGRVKPTSTNHDTIAGLIASYLRSAEYVELRDTTKRGYMARIEALRTKHGHRSVSGLTRARIESGILSDYIGKPGARLATLKMLRVLIRHAIKIDWLDRDPSLGIKRPKTGEIRSWTETEIARFEARWLIGTKQRLAFALFLYTGQRRSDVHRMTWADIAGDRVRVVQQKTGADLLIPIHAELAKALAVTKREHVTILNTDYGQPFTVDGFGNWMRDAITTAGLPLSAQPHGLRKAAGRRLADAGCSSHEIMAVLGHKTLAEAERYTRDADQVRLSGSGIAKLEGKK
ncbi:MAG: tyrosine-type recombinase/integrase [bacterium]|nr:tyrosine-type recombinase/integrase [bacterium]